MTASQTTTTATTATTTQENAMNTTQRECFTNYEGSLEVDHIIELIEEEDFAGVQDAIDRIIKDKDVAMIRTVAMELQIEDISGMVTHRNSEEFQGEIEYILNHLNCSDSKCQGEKRAKFAASFGYWELMLKNGEYFFQHENPKYVSGKLTMIEPMIVNGVAQAIFNYNALNTFNVPMPCDRQRNALMEDTDQIGDVVFAANRWLRENA